MSNNICKFFREHIKMSMYGTRCEIWDHFGLNPTATEVEDKDKDIVAQLKEMDTDVEACINELDTIAEPENTKFDMSKFDAFRMEIENATVACREKIDKRMCSDVLRNRLFEIAMAKQREEERRRIMANAKNAVNPVNISGSPADFGGATTVKVEKKDDGSAEIKPVTNN